MDAEDDLCTKTQHGLTCVERRDDDPCDRCERDYRMEAEAMLRGIDNELEGILSAARASERERCAKLLEIDADTKQRWAETFIDGHIGRAGLLDIALALREAASAIRALPLEGAKP